MTIDTLGGYRLTRKLGEGPRAELFLAHPDGEEPAAPARVIKIFRAEVDDSSIVTEVEALSRAAGEHSLELIDLTTARDGSPALILQRLGTGGLARLLRERAGLRPGEAITLLAPLAMTLARLHRRGVVHGAVGVDSVLFDPAGAPVLACFGRSGLIAPGLPVAGLESEPGVLADVSAFAALARMVLDRVNDDATAALGDEVGSVLGSSSEGLQRFALRLFELGAPTAIDFRADEQAAPTLPGRVITAAPVPEPEAEAAPPRSGVRAALALPEFLERLLPAGTPGTAALARLAALAHRLRAWLATVRPRFWVVAGAVGLCLLAGLILVPQGSRDATANPVELSSSETPAGPSALDGPGGGADPDGAGGAPGADDPLSADDPLAAAQALLRARERCIRELSVLCLDAVAQQDSAALLADRELLRELQTGAEMPPPFQWTSEDLLITERLGNSAIVSLGEVPETTPASLLLMKGEAGWRIRDYLQR